MPLRRFRRQYEQRLRFDGGRIIGMLEAGWSARLVASQLSRSDCVVRRFYTKTRLRTASTDRHIVRNVCVPPYCKKCTRSSAAIQA
ncbi:hypothetical protein TNCV_3470301 [Trichonephila clavipes]|nr:hypothetical protein TNCV_3470301 [Trichonephila clavipes]